MLLSLFSWINCVFGGFPFLFMRTADNWYIELCPCAILCWFAMIWSYYHVSNSKNLCLSFSWKGLEPQKYNCIFYELVLGVVFFCRLLKLKDIKALFVSASKYVKLPDQVLKCSAVILLLHMILNCFTICVYYIGFGMSLDIFIDHVIGTFPGRFGYYCVSSLAVFIFGAIQKSLSEVNVMLAPVLDEPRVLSTFRKHYNKCYTISCECMSVLGFDLFLTLTATGANFYVRLHDFVSVTIQMFFRKTATYKFFLISVFFYVGMIFVSLLHVFWFASVYVKLRQEV